MKVSIGDNARFSKNANDLLLPPQPCKAERSLESCLFFNSPSLTAPAPPRFACEAQDASELDVYTEKPKYSAYDWPAVYSRSTVADSKQLDDSHSSSFVYDYDAQDTVDDDNFNRGYCNGYIENCEENIMKSEANVDDLDSAAFIPDTSNFGSTAKYGHSNDLYEYTDGNETNYWAYLRKYSAGLYYADPIDAEAASQPEEHEALPSDDDNPENPPQHDGTHVLENNDPGPDENEQGVSNQSLPLEPYSLDEIDKQVEIREVPGKGRCTFARREFKPGDIIYVEAPLLIATPQLDPALWDVLIALNEAQNFELPPTWHLATLYSITKLPERDQSLLFDKWVPDPNKEPSDDVKRILAATELDINPYTYERALQVWRYNSFGHHSSPEGLALYNRISMLAHDCNASATWHYGYNDTFTLRARQLIRKGGEITLSYIGDEELMKPIHVRQDRLHGWLFLCACEKCSSDKDVARGFRCPVCGSGSVFLKTTKEPYAAATVEATSSTSCSICRAELSDEDRQLYFDLEVAYINRLSETSKEDLLDVEHVYSEARRVFSQHWVLYQLDSMLTEGYRDKSRWEEAIYHQTKRLEYVSQVMPSISYSLAWLYEELGDLYAHKYNIVMDAPVASTSALTGYQKNVLIDKYEMAVNKLLLICGPENEYTITSHEKLQHIYELGKDCFSST